MKLKRFNFNNHFGLVSDCFDDAFEFSVLRKQQKKADEDMQRMKESMTECEELCSLVDIERLLIKKGINATDLSYSKTDFCEHLNAKICKQEFSLNIALFPKKKHPDPISLVVEDLNRHEWLSRNSTPESVVRLMMDIAAWVPEYHAYIEELEAKEKQRELACRISMNLLEKTISQIIIDKGYEYEIYQTSNGKASLRIQLSEAVQITIEVDLLGDYLDQIMSITSLLQKKYISGEKVFRQAFEDPCHL